MLTKMKAPMGLTTMGFRVKLEAKMSVEPSAKDDESMAENETTYGTVADYGDRIEFGMQPYIWRGRSTPQREKCVGEGRCSMKCKKKKEK